MDPGEAVAQADLAEYGFVVVGVKSAGDKLYEVGSLAWKPMTVEQDGKVTPSFFAIKNTSSRHGGPYAVMKVSAMPENTVLGLTEVYGFQAKKTFCGGELIPVISVKPGEVIYAGDVHAITQGRKLSFKYFYGIDAARSFVQARFPELAERMQGRQFVFRRISGSSLVCL